MNYIPRRPKRNSKIEIKSPADILSTGGHFYLGLKGQLNFGARGQIYLAAGGIIAWGASFPIFAIVTIWLRKCLSTKPFDTALSFNFDAIMNHC